MGMIVRFKSGGGDWPPVPAGSGLCDAHCD